LNKLDQAYSLIKQRGILKFTWLGFRYILRKTLWIDWRTCTYFKRSLDKPILDIVPKIPVEIRQATVEDLPKLKEIVDEAKYDRFKRRFQEGNICFIALDKEKIVSFSWIGLSNKFEPELRVEIKLAEKEAYLFDAYVVPEYRNHGLYPVVGNNNLKYLRNLGFKQVIIFVDNTNIFSLKAVNSSGFNANRALTCFSIFGLTFHLWHNNPGTFAL
jgi:hypothetical protein